MQSRAGTFAPPRAGARTKENEKKNTGAVASTKRGGVATLTLIINRALNITLLISIVKVERVRCIVVIRPAISAVETTSSSARPDTVLPEQVGMPQIFRWHVEKRFCVGDRCTYIITSSGALFSSKESGTKWTQVQLALFLR